MSLGSGVVPLCQALVQRKSLSGREAGVAGVVEAAMRELGFDEVRRDAFGSVCGVVKGARPGRRVLMDAHMDVVPVTEPDKWHHDPFGGELEGGRLWGRGATDVKGSLAAMVFAVGTLDRDQLSGSVIVSAGVAEEGVEGYALAGLLAEEHADVVVICEPTNLMIGLGHKGRARVRIVAEGVASHSSKPSEGVNAVLRMVAALERLEHLEPANDPLLGSGIAEIIGIRSQPNKPTAMVPYECTVEIDRRTVRGETAPGVVAEIAKLLEGVEGVEGVSVSLRETLLDLYTGHSLRVNEFHPAWAIEPTTDLAVRARSALRQIGQGGEFFYAPYCTNGSHSGGVLSIPTIIYGAGGIEQAHVIDEWVDTAELEEAARGYQALALELGD